MRKTIAAAAALLLLAFGLAAQEPELQMEDVVVTATRTASRILDAPGHVSVITSREIAASGAAGVADLLRQEAGVQVLDNGTAGSVQSARLRGSTSAQVLILLDGVRQNDSRQGGADLSQIPLESVERIEVIRGDASALYGADAVAGVINIITRKKADGRLTLSLENGSYLPHRSVAVAEGGATSEVPADPLDLVDTQKLAAGYSAKVAGLDLVAQGSFIRAGNGFVWNDQSYVGDYRRRVNADLLGASGHLAVSEPLPSGRWGVDGTVTYRDLGAPGSITSDYSYYFVSTDARQRLLTAQGKLFLDSGRFLTDRLTLAGRLFYRYTSLGYEDPPATPDLHQLHTVGLDASQKLYATDALSFVYGGNLLYDYVDSTRIGRLSRLSGGLFLEAPLYPLPAMALIPAVRYDLVSDFPGSLTYHLSAVWNLSSSLSLKAGGGKSYRAPTMNDLYWPLDLAMGTGGNPDLRPETGYSGDLGVSMATKGVGLNAYAYLRYLRDAIEWIETAPFFYQPVNYGQSLYPGFETDLDLALTPALSLRGSYTFSYSFLLQGATAAYTLQDDRRVPYAPVHAATAAVQFDDGTTLARLEGQLTGPRFTDEANLQAQPAYLVLNAELRRQLTKALAVSLAVKNLLNSSYEVVSGYIMPPVSAWLGLEARL